MLELRGAAVTEPDLAGALELALLVELEARWENLRKAPAQAKPFGSTTQDLLGIQKAYDAFRGKLVAYNKRHAPPHVPELLLNTPVRLALWCRSMRQLYLRVEHLPQVRCPVQLLEKAHRLAERMGARLGRESPPRQPAPDTLAAAQDFEALAQWCDDLAGAAVPAVAETPTFSGA